MARLNNLWDSDRLKDVRARQVDPIVQHIVVRKMSENPPAFADVAADAARAVRQASRFAHDPEHADLYALWLARSFRKIALRATGGQFDRLVAAMECEVVGDVAALPPMLHSTRDRIFSQMQNLVMLKNLAELPAFEAPAPGLTLIVNTSLSMSHGKALAQIGHGALRPSWPEGSADPSVPITVVGADAAQLARIEAEHDVWVVQDGGLTDIEPGSETVFVVEGN
jgi:peptidyl-tRNA hydrolase